MPSLPALKTLSAALLGATAISAHGIAYGINVAGTYYEGYDPTTIPFKPVAPTVVGWTSTDLNTGFIAPAEYASPDIICHHAAKPAAGYAAAAAGDKLAAYWTPWPATHHGPVIDMLANCHGDCTTVDKTKLEWFKIGGVGLVDDAVAPGNWATDTLIANNNSWVVQLPADLAAGNYVWRHEIIALHSAENSDGAQNYPQCFNLAVSGAGVLAPDGTRGEALYSEKEAGIALDIYYKLSSYDIPGPTQIPAGTNLAQSELPIERTSAAYTTGVSESGAGAAVPTMTAAAVTSHFPTSKAAISKSMTSKTVTSSSVKATSHPAHSTSSGAAIVKSSATKSSDMAAAMVSSGYGTDKPCNHGRYARGFEA